jgi:hypothetical protein
MAILNITINSDVDSIKQLNSKVLTPPGAPLSPPAGYHNCLNSLIDYLSAYIGGENRGIIEVVSRDTDPAVGTSGTGSVKITFTHH